mmetsp:Transcript_14014/g.23276  ORF Transcript_14014/g.23276 Transcript_14014/m.23276 type:complete len:224 (+) Transcript_14014:757-1428(+)
MVVLVAFWRAREVDIFRDIAIDYGNSFVGNHTKGVVTKIFESVNPFALVDHESIGLFVSFPDSEEPFNTFESRQKQLGVNVNLQGIDDRIDAIVENKSLEMIVFKRVESNVENYREGFPANAPCTITFPGHVNDGLQESGLGDQLSEVFTANLGEKLAHLNLEDCAVLFQNVFRHIKNARTQHDLDVKVWTTADVTKRSQCGFLVVFMRDELDQTLCQWKSSD